MRTDSPAMVILYFLAPSFFYCLWMLAVVLPLCFGLASWLFNCAYIEASISYFVMAGTVSAYLLTDSDVLFYVSLRVASSQFA